jgi:hypothetical protein
MGDIRLTSPRVIVLRDGYDPLEIQTANPDLILWDRTRIKHRWPKFDEAPFLWLTFLAWAAARRTGAIPTDMTWDRWEAEVMEVTDANQLDADAEPDELGSPTEPGHAPG